MLNEIEVIGARVHNLKNINVNIPRDSLTVITGLSGSGKSSLAFDTLYAEGQRRYIETFSAYARNFLGNLERPDVDKITGLSPVISIEQKTTNRNPRSTVGTVTEVYDYMRLLFARAGTAYSYVTGEPMVKYNEEKILDLILHDYNHRPIYILAPLVRSRKGHYRELFDSMLRKGFINIRVDGEMKSLVPGMKVDRYKNHNIEVVVDKLVADEKDAERLKKSIAQAMTLGDGLVMLMEKGSNEGKFYSRRLMCPTSGISYNDPAPNNFSFNSPEGACPRCKGLGFVNLIDEDKIIPNRSLSVAEGALAPLGKARQTMIFHQIEAILEHHGYNLRTPISQLSDEALHDVIYGADYRVCIKASKLHTQSDFYCMYEGISKFIHALAEEETSAAAQRWADSFDRVCECPECHGARLKRESLHYRIGEKNIAELSSMDIIELYDWAQHINAELTPRQAEIADLIIKEISKRLKFLLDVGLDYLSLNRPSATLSGGESQRIRLATQIGSGLINVLYILDEPSIGLHQRDNVRLINSLKGLRDLGNTVIVVEHDRDMMLAADYIVDIGPKAGRQGGEVVFQGTPAQLLKADTITARYLRGEETVEGTRKATQTTAGEGQVTRPVIYGNVDEYDSHYSLPKDTDKASTDHVLRLLGCRGNNLQNVDVSFPLGKLICITGVSGSGKSTLINDTLQPILSQRFFRSLKEPLPYDAIEGVENVDKVISVDQSPLGRTPRSNPATYTSVFSDIRSLFVEMPEAKMRGYKAGQFSFNVKGGRCEACGGNGYKTIAMNFLPDIQVPCEVCHGQRYNRATLEVRFKGKSIADVLDMTINEAVEFFENQPHILQKIKTLKDVGLGYIKLGQPSTTLSGGESQRVKLATELARRDTGRTIFILDEPTTGLHFADIRALLDVLRRLVDKGNTVIVIEHNMDVIKAADHIIDIGPDGGRRGGQIVAVGTPTEIAHSAEGFTAEFLRREYNIKGVV